MHSPSARLAAWMAPCTARPIRSAASPGSGWPASSQAMTASVVRTGISGAVQDRPVQVSLGLEVPVEDHPGDPGFGRHVVQAGRGEPGAGEGAGGGGEDLLAPLGPAQPAGRLGCTRCTHRRPAPLLFTREYTYSLVYAE